MFTTEEVTKQCFYKTNSANQIELKKSILNFRLLDLFLCWGGNYNMFISSYEWNIFKLSFNPCYAGNIFNPGQNYVENIFNSGNARHFSSNLTI